MSEDTLCTLRQVLKRIPMSKSAWWANVKRGRLPAPVKIGGRTFWRQSDIDRVIGAQL